MLGTLDPEHARLAPLQVHHDRDGRGRAGKIGISRQPRLTHRLLQGLELVIYDQWVRHASRAEEPRSRIVILAITERDIREQGHWPLSDRTMTKLLRALLAADPTVVGLDIYRDLPVPPGEALLAALLESEPRIIGVTKFGGVEDEGIPGPRGLEDSERVGFNDILLDPDTTVRRGLLFLDEGDEQVEFSFALRVAMAALAREGVHPRPDSEEPDWLRLPIGDGRGRGGQPPPAFFRRPPQSCRRRRRD